MPTTSEDTKVAPPGKTRIFVPMGIIAFCAFAYFFSTQFERVPPILKRGIQPSDFPQLVIGLIVFLCVLLLIKDKSPDPTPLLPKVWSTIGLLLAFTIVSQADFFLGLGLFAGALALLWNERRPSVVVLVTILVPLAVFFLFDSVFEVRFPRGLLTNIWYG